MWARFGAVDNYVEPFFGSGAVLLSCPNPGHTETVNDADGLLANFWRALQYAPDETAHYADWPVNEADLHARHRWLVDRRSMVEQLMADPEWYDPQAAGWWVWGISQWIGGGWCPRTAAVQNERSQGLRNDGTTEQRRPRLGGGKRSGGMSGVHRASLALPLQVPMLHGDSGASGRGVHAKRLAKKMPFIASPSADRKQHGLGVHGIRLSRKMPHISASGTGAIGAGIHAGFFDEKTGGIYVYFRTLSARLRRTRVVCGDFARILGPSVTWRHGMTAVFLDPPYADAEHAVQYSGGGQVWERVTRWCEENGSHRDMRIALCGYEDTWHAPEGWQLLKWRTNGGYGSQGNARGRENANREAIWFSPACLKPADEARAAFDRPITVRDADYTGTMFEERAE